MYMTVLKMTRKSIIGASNLLNVNSKNSIHQWLTNQQDKSRAEDKILYKIIEQNNEMFMYIQTLTKFNAKNIELYGFEFIKDFEFGIDSLPEYATFDVQTFPCRTTDDKRYFLKNLDDRYEWLRNQFEKNGITLLDCAEYKQSDIILDKTQYKRIPTASYKGKIQIVDKEKAFNLITNGLGRMKNYGLGLVLYR